MKVNFKRVATTAVAVAMSLSLAAPAFAAGSAGDKTLTVTGDTLDNKKVYAVQMFDARVTEGANNTFDNYEMVNSEKWMAFFKASADQGGVGLTDLNKDGNTDADDARAYLENLETESADIKSFADKAQAWVRHHSTDFDVINSDTEKEPVADQETFTHLKPGYYLVYPEGGSTGTNSRGTDAMLVNVPRDEGEATLNIKSTFPTVDKTVEDNNENTNGDGANGSAQVGDIVTFTLTSKVPDMSDYTTFYFAFNDTLSDGLKVVDNAGNDVADGDKLTIDGLTVTIDGENVSGHTVSLHDNVLKVEFTDLKSVGQANQSEDIGKAIVVTYQAKITEAAVSGSGSIVGNAQNDVYLEYSNDPTTDTKGESTPDTSKVYTYDITVDKYELVKKPGDSGEEIEQGLAGAKFVLSKDETLNGTGTDGYTNAIAIKDAGNNTYKVDPTGSTYEFTTVAGADITIEGLEAGTYYLHEVAAPTGYNKLADPLEIKIIVDKEIAAHYAPEDDSDKYNDVSFEKPLYVVDEKPNAINNDTIKVLNKKGIELPETGSIGTIGLTVAGVAIVLLGVFAPRKKKKGNQE